MNRTSILVLSLSLALFGCDPEERAALPQTTVAEKPRDSSPIPSLASAPAPAPASSSAPTINVAECIQEGLKSRKEMEKTWHEAGRKYGEEHYPRIVDQIRKDIRDYAFDWGVSADKKNIDGHVIITDKDPPKNFPKEDWLEKAFAKGMTQRVGELLPSGIKLTNSSACLLPDSEDRGKEKLHISLNFEVTIPPEVLPPAAPGTNE